MSFVSVFRFRGVWWTHRTYKKNGKRKHCYSAKSGYEPIFSEEKLTNEQIAAKIDKHRNVHNEP